VTAEGSGADAGRPLPADAPVDTGADAPFDAPWQVRAFGLTSALVDAQLAGDREPFRRRLVAAIGSAPQRPYWESWTVALEALVTDLGWLDAGAVADAAGT
jgi:hypothetical protein